MNHSRSKVDQENFKEFISKLEKEEKKEKETFNDETNSADLIDLTIDEPKSIVDE